MAQVIQPWQILLAGLAGWVNRQQQAVIEYLREENRILKEQLGGRRLRLTDDQRRRLAAKSAEPRDPADAGVWEVDRIPDSSCPLWFRRSR